MLRKTLDFVSFYFKRYRFFYISLFACILLSIVLSIGAFFVNQAQAKTKTQKVQGVSNINFSRSVKKTTSPFSYKVIYSFFAKVTPNSDSTTGNSTPTLDNPKPEQQKREQPSSQLTSISIPAESNGSTFTPKEIFDALNKYRQSKGLNSLSWDQRLADYSQSRAEQFARDGKMDNHEGFKTYMNEQLGVNYSRMGENSGYGHKVSATELIEQKYGSSPGHNENQLKPEYTVVGIGVSGTASNLIFGTPK